MKPRIQVFENMLGDWTASNGMLTVFGKSREDALQRFKHYSKYGVFEE